MLPLQDFNNRAVATASANSGLRAGLGKGLHLKLRTTIAQFIPHRFISMLAVLMTMVASTLLAPAIAYAQADEVVAVDAGSYTLNAGDVISLAVWNEPSMSAEQLLVRPDGFISVPVIGEIRAGQRTVGELQNAVAVGLNRYLKDQPSVVISVLNAGGSRVYVLGKVQRPGVFGLSGPMDVTQALALAGGLNSFAAENNIRVLRRDAGGVQRPIRFKYGRVKDGDNLDSNILLHSGDVVLVP